MNVRIGLFAALFLFNSAAYAAESGYTIKPADLKDKPYIDAVTVVTLASADPKDNFLTLLTKTHPPPQTRLDSLAPGLATLDGIKAPQNPTRFQQYTRKLRVASR